MGVQEKASAAGLCQPRGDEVLAGQGIPWAQVCNEAALEARPGPWKNLRPWAAGPSGGLGAGNAGN